MCGHVARFYADAYPAEAVSEFFASGLEVGESCLALLKAPHRLAVEQCMRARGIALERVAYVAVDSDEAWSKVQVDGRLDVSRAHELLAQFMIPPADGRNGRVRAVGDLAPTLCAIGKTEDALAFESIVHRLTQEHGGSTICAYPIKSHLADDGMRAFLRLSAQHAVVEFPQQLWVHHLVPEGVAGAWPEHYRQDQALCPEWARTRVPRPTAEPGWPGPIARIGHENLAQPTQHVLALTALQVLMKDPSPLLAKAAHAKWLDGQRFVIAEVQRDYGVKGLSVTAAP